MTPNQRLAAATLDDLTPATVDTRHVSLACAAMGWAVRMRPEQVGHVVEQMSAKDADDVLLALDVLLIPALRAKAKEA